nr:hypothetical protein [Paenibacillus bovis]
MPGEGEKGKRWSRWNVHRARLGGKRDEVVTLERSSFPVKEKKG